MTRAVAILAISGAALWLAGCGGGSSSALRGSLGLLAPPPDEFLIVARAPLQTPPDFAALPQPSLGAPSRVEVDATAAAQAALAGAGARSPGAAPAASEQALVRAVGGDAVEPGIRETLVVENRPTQRRFGLDSVLGFPIQQDPAKAADQLDPAAEAERLRAGGLRAPVAPPAAQP